MENAQIQYIGARYVTKVYENSQNPNSAEWEADTVYEPLTMVTYQNGSYLSKKTVPATIGNPAANGAYWTQTGFYNGQIAHLQEQIDEIHETFVTPQMFGAVGDGVTDDTASIQSAIDNSYKVYFPKGEYRITMDSSRYHRHNFQNVCYGLKIENNDLYFEDCVIKMDGHNSPYYFMLFLYNAKNTYIHGKVTLIGDRTTNTGGDTRGEGHVIAVMHGHNITIDGVTVKDAWGDGIWLMNDGYIDDVLTPFPKNVNINNVLCDHNRRNGLAICCGENVSVTNSEFDNSTETLPKLGIDVEANGDGYSVKNITICNVKSYGCTSGGFATVMKTDDDSVSWNGAVSDGSFALTIDTTCENGIFNASNIVNGDFGASDNLILLNKGTDCVVNVNNVFCKPNASWGGVSIANHQNAGKMILSDIKMDANNYTVGSAKNSPIWVADNSAIYDLIIKNMVVYGGKIYKPFTSAQGLSVPAGNNCDVEMDIIDCDIQYDDSYWGFFHNDIITNNRLKYHNNQSKLIGGTGHVRGNYSKYTVDGTLENVYLKNLISGTHYLITNTSDSVDVYVNMYSPQVQITGETIANYFTLPHGHSAEVWLNEEQNIYNGIIF